MTTKTEVNYRGYACPFTLWTGRRIFTATEIEHAAHDWVNAHIMLNLTSCVCHALAEHRTFFGDDEVQAQLTTTSNYEEAARAAGWEEDVICPDGYHWCFGHSNYDEYTDDYATWEELCSYQGIEAEAVEVLEWFAVTGHAKVMLEERGERVVDVENVDWNVWCRTTSGQAIEADECIQSIAQENLEFLYKPRIKHLY